MLRRRTLLPSVLREAGVHVLLRRIFADDDSAETFWRLRSGDVDHPAAVRVRSLGGAGVTLRPNTEDVAVFIDTFFGRHHRPPRAAHPISRIIDLGANIGLTTADLAHSNPGAIVTAVEMDHANATLCTSNTEPWRPRCHVKETAIWPGGGSVRYDRKGSLTSRHSIAPEGSVHTPAIGLTELIGPDRIDYVKIDIEGAEARLLSSDTNWARQVKTVRVEVHDGYPVMDCVRDLQRIGFAAQPDRRHRGYVTGVKRA